MSSTPELRRRRPHRAPAGRRHRTSGGWVRGGGLTTLAFAAPMLIVFALLSWYRFVPAVPMSLRAPNLVPAPVFVGLANFRQVVPDPLLPIPTRITAYFA